MRLLLALLLLALLAPAVPAQPSGAIDATLTIEVGSAPRIHAPPGLMRANESESGERYTFDLALAKEYTTLELRLRGFDVERPRQVVPSLVVPETQYPLFYPFANERIWEVEGTVNVFHVNGTASDIQLRLGVAGPRNVTLVLARDVTPPKFALGPVEVVTPVGFLQNTTTEELALGDLQVRALGEEEWIPNPTTEYHFIQRFPVQGLDADREHEARLVFTDWAENVATSETYTVRTPPSPVRPAPIITPVEPAPNATLPNGSATIRATIDLSAGPLMSNGITLFLDKRPVVADMRFEDGVFSYTPLAPLEPGLHTIGLEATNELGGKGVARWSFTVDDGARETSWPTLGAGLALVAVGLLGARRR